MKITLALLIALSSVSVSAKSLDFPDTTRSWRQSPETLHASSVQRLAIGMDKRQIYQILGKPHFNEGLGAHSWVYWYANNAQETCLLKIRFERRKIVALDWSTAACKDTVK